MINIALMTATFILAQYGSGYGAPPSSSYQGASGQGLDTAPFVQLQRKCFDKAVSETRDAAPEVKQQRFDTCFALHDAMVKHATVKLGEKEAAAAKHDIDRALGGVEKNLCENDGCRDAR